MPSWQDANYNVTSLFDNSGEVVERYVYDPYGKVTVLDANVNWDTDADGISDVGWVYLHQGGRHDVSLKLSHFRYRDLHVDLGRWTRQDPLGYIDGANTYQAYISSPVDLVDWNGLRVPIKPDFVNNNPSLGRGQNPGYDVVPPEWDTMRFVPGRGKFIGLRVGVNSTVALPDGTTEFYPGFPSDWQTVGLPNGATAVFDPYPESEGQDNLPAPYDPGPISQWKGWRYIRAIGAGIVGGAGLGPWGFFKGIAYGLAFEGSLDLTDPTEDDDNNGPIIRR